MMSGQVQEAAMNVGREIGESDGKIRVAQVDWTPFIQQGVLVDLHIGRYRAQVSVTLDDLGINPSTNEERQALERTLSLGRRFLLPKETLNRAQEIEGWSRQWLLKNSFKTFWGQFIHVSRYKVWRERQLEIEQEYLGLAFEIENKYPSLLRQVRDDYLLIGREIWLRLMKSGKLPESSSSDDYANNFAENALRGIPSAAEIRRSFIMSYDVRYIPPQAMVATDRVAVEQIVMEAQERARLNAEMAMRADLQITEARQAAGGIRQFVEDVQGQVRGAIYDHVIAALETLREGRNGRMPRGTTLRIKNMIEMVDDLVFWDDRDLKQKCAELSDLCEITAAKRDTGEVERVLRELGTEARLTLVRLNRTPERSGKSLGIPDTQPELMVKFERSVRRGDWGMSTLSTETTSEFPVRTHRTLAPY